MTPSTSLRPTGIEQVLQRARNRFERVRAHELDDERRRGAFVVDIRPAVQRTVYGEIPYAVPIERNVLEWRLDPSSGAAIGRADHDLRVVVVCQEGYTSSLAAAALLDLGIHRATDLEGGYVAWRSLQPG